MCFAAYGGIITLSTPQEEQPAVKQYSCFDVLGPVMIGPSSSHTAGACRLGQLARAISGGEVSDARFYLHGSFAATFRGHGTDRALLAGVLGMQPDDERLPESFAIARSLGVTYEFSTVDLGEDAHPNSVSMHIRDSAGTTTHITGASLGAGKVKITSIDGLMVDFSGDYHTIITLHHDRPGIVARVSSELAAHSVNIAFMKVFREQRGSNACMVIESDQSFPEGLGRVVSQIPGVRRTVVLEPI